jgi:hypothetical protein
MSVERMPQQTSECLVAPPFVWSNTACARVCERETCLSFSLRALSFEPVLVSVTASLRLSLLRVAECCTWQRACVVQSHVLWGCAHGFRLMLVRTFKQTLLRFPLNNHSLCILSFLWLSSILLFVSHSSLYCFVCCVVLLGCFNVSVDPHLSTTTTAAAALQAYETQVLGSSLFSAHHSPSHACPPLHTTRMHPLPIDRSKRVCFHSLLRVQQTLHFDVIKNNSGESKARMSHLIGVALRCSRTPIDHSITSFVDLLPPPLHSLSRFLAIGAHHLLSAVL